MKRPELDVFIGESVVLAQAGTLGLGNTGRLGLVSNDAADRSRSSHREGFVVRIEQSLRCGHDRSVGAATSSCDVLVEKAHV